MTASLLVVDATTSLSFICWLLVFWPINAINATVVEANKTNSDTLYQLFISALVSVSLSISVCFSISRNVCPCLFLLLLLAGWLAGWLAVVIILLL